MSDPGSEFSDINDSAIKALKWKADKSFNFAIKDNFKYIITDQDFSRTLLTHKIGHPKPKLINQ
ncbi:hypothetical protein RhiirA1_480145 [Rhizophagus irregularis]|uniref:Uncharacterized protein n=1 Tax=Rhizophagus irregularis TaxID=588596 RepID=A0A2N0QPR3_9GLOM|nr:hypothetical protein RhiirA1_480145 [Rhizophagus irregularis]